MSYKNQIKITPGKKVKEIMIFGLSTCFWCEKTKDLLNELNLEYGYVDFDLLEGLDQKEAYKEMSKYNPRASFPTVVINNGEKVVIGFDEAEIRNLADGK